LSISVQKGDPYGQCGLGEQSKLVAFLKVNRYTLIKTRNVSLDLEENQVNKFVKLRQLVQLFCTVDKTLKSEKNFVP